MPATQRKTWTPEEEHQFLLEIEQYKTLGITEALKTVAPRYGLSFSAARTRYYLLRNRTNNTTSSKQVNSPQITTATPNQTYDCTEALNKAYKLLVTRSRQTKDGRLDYKEIETISNAVGLPYAKVLSLWGTANQAGFWAVAEARKLQERIQSLEIERELYKKELKERAEAFDRYYYRSEKVKAALRAIVGKLKQEAQNQTTNQIKTIKKLEAENERLKNFIKLVKEALDQPFEVS